jgi:hypothetical protein
MERRNFPCCTSNRPSSFSFSRTLPISGGMSIFVCRKICPSMNGVPFTARRSRSRRSPWGMETSRLMVRRKSLSCLITPPLVVNFVVPSVALTRCRIVFPLVPSISASNRVTSGTGLPAIFSRKSGTEACPFAWIEFRVPSKWPVELRIPAMAANTPRSAFSNV